MESEDREMTDSEPKADHPVAGTICAIDRKSVHRICSGQVVLTLATAVKELLENSIDAGATIVDIKLKDYGSELIEVSDNGMGVQENNFQALTLKHYTSKLQDFSDLINVETFGFRGEALSSLCALSDMTVTTKHKDAAVGTKLEFDHNGKITKQTNQARQVGTTVTLQNLFYTLPVRHKEFQRNTKKEFVKMVQVLNSYCIISTGVRISCTNQTGKGSRSTVVSSQGNVNMLENISNVFGPKQSQGLLEFKKIEPNEDQCSEFGIKGNNSSLFSIEGYVSKCEHGQGRSSTDRQFFFINGRPFDSAKLSKVVNEVYHQYNRHQYPFVVFKITVEKDNVDVNVTPDKRQVFLEGEKLIMATVKASLIAMYEPTTSVLQYQPVPAQSFGKPDCGENTRLVKHQSLEKPTGLTSLMKLKRSFSSAFSKEDSSSVLAASPTVSSPLMKQRRLDAFVSSYHSPSKLHKDTEFSNNHGKSPDDDDDVVIVNPSQELPSHIAIDGSKKQLTDGTTALYDVSDKDHEELNQRKLAEFENVIPDEKGDHLNVHSLYTIYSMHKSDKGKDQSRTIGQEPELSEHDDASSSHIGANHLQKISQLLGNDTRSVHNEFSCVQNDSKVQAILLSKENCVFSDKFSVKNEECIRNKRCFEKDVGGEEKQCVQKDGTCIHPDNSVWESCRDADKNQTDRQDTLQNEEQSDRLCSVEDKMSFLSNKLGNSSNLKTGNLSTEENSYDTSLRNNVSIVRHESQTEKTEEFEQTGDCHIVHDTEEDVERKEMSVGFSMQSLCSRWNSRRKDKTHGEFSRTFRATINPTENQAAEQELQREIKKDMFAQMEILGQFNLGFIIAKLEKDLFIVDQHATDEKYNFETLQRDTIIHSQKLICPLNLELTSSNETILIDNLDIFRKNGFEFVINEEGQPTQRVKLASTPVSKNWNFGKEDIEEMLFMLTYSPGVACRPSRVRAMFASRACRKSVMIGTTLNKAEMKKLVCHMGEIEQPWNCPHGRPTMRHLINLDMVPRT